MSNSPAQKGVFLTLFHVFLHVNKHCQKTSLGEREKVPFLSKTRLIGQALDQTRLFAKNVKKTLQKPSEVTS